VSQRLYKRSAKLVLARPLAGSYVGVQPNAIEITGLRIQFQIEKTLEAEPNSGSIVVTNLAKTTRAEFNRKPLHVTLDAGYDGNLKRIFTGDLRWVTSTHTPPDWDTKIELGDGERAYKHARVNRSFAPGIDSKAVLAEIADSMGLKMPTSAAEATDLMAQFSTGVTIQGPSAAEMDRILAPHARAWSIQDGSLQILAAAETRVGTAFMVSPDTGLVGAPTMTAPGNSGEPATLAATMLLYPEMLPGSKVEMKSASVAGLFKVRKVTHKGDTHGADWTTTIEGVPL